jgi:hypothetical protein
MMITDENSLDFMGIDKARHSVHNHAPVNAKLRWRTTKRQLTAISGLRDGWRQSTR